MCIGLRIHADNIFALVHLTEAIMHITLLSLLWQYQVLLLIILCLSFLVTTIFQIIAKICNNDGILLEIEKL